MWFTHARKFELKTIDPKLNYGYISTKNTKEHAL